MRPSRPQRGRACSQIAGRSPPFPPTRSLVRRLSRPQPGPSACTKPGLPFSGATFKKLAGVCAGGCEHGPPTVLTDRPCEQASVPGRMRAVVRRRRCDPAGRRHVRGALAPGTGLVVRATRRHRPNGRRSGVWPAGRPPISLMDTSPSLPHTRPGLGRGRRSGISTRCTSRVAGREHGRRVRRRVGAGRRGSLAACQPPSAAARERHPSGSCSPGFRLPNIEAICWSSAV